MKRRRRWIKKALGTHRRRKGLRARGYTPKLHKHRRHRKRYRVEAAHKGALHRMLDVPEGTKIPLHLLQKFKHATGKLGQRVRFALNVRGLRHRRRS